jgi:hypothetical protein
MPGVPPFTYDPGANRATAKRLEKHTVYLSLEGGGTESFSLFTGEQIGDRAVEDDEAVIDYFERLLGGLGWDVSRSDTPGPDDQIATWLLAPGSD